MILDDIAAKFKNLQIDEETKLLKPRQYRAVGSFPAALEQWKWEGVRGKSIIFLKSDVGSLSDQALLDLLAHEVVGETDATISRREEFIYINHSFVA